MQNRDYVLPDDILALAPSVLTHRLLPSVEAAMGGRTTASILDSILSSVPVPEGTRA
jgi:MoxR-like ATPase